MMNIYKPSDVSFEIFAPYDTAKKNKYLPKYAIANGIANDITRRLLQSIVSLNKTIFKFISEDK